MKLPNNQKAPNRVSAMTMEQYEAYGKQGGHCHETPKRMLERALLAHIQASGAVPATYASAETFLQKILRSWRLYEQADLQTKKSQLNFANLAIISANQML